MERSTKFKVYYARPINLYNTPQDIRDLELLTNLGFEIVNPNKAELERRYATEGMDVYLNIIPSVDVVAFRSLPNLDITAGVYKEISKAYELGLYVFELPTIMSKRVLSVDDTREYLKLIGIR